MTLLVCSKSTRDYLPHYKRTFIVNGPPQSDILKLKDSEEEVIAIGGGAVIDTAKIISKNPIICYPTTLAGSSATEWSVYWDGSVKYSMKCSIPKQAIFVPEFISNLPENIKTDTVCDVISHCLDSLSSIKANDKSIENCKLAISLLKTNNPLDLLKAGHYAGLAIQITGTNLLHSLSYPITSKYKIPHGRALGCLLPKLLNFMSHVLSKDELNIVESIILNLPFKLSDYNINIEDVIQDSYTYSKISEYKFPINQEILTNLLKSI